MRLARTGIHPGTLPFSGSFVKVDSAEFVVSAVCQSEDGDGWLLRGYNITSNLVQVTCCLGSY